MIDTPKAHVDLNFFITVCTFQTHDDVVPIFCFYLIIFLGLQNNNVSYIQQRNKIMTKEPIKTNVYSISPENIERLQKFYQPWNIILKQYLIDNNITDQQGLPLWLKN